MKDLTGKKIIVLGATGGIGEGITRQLLHNGATVVALCRTDEKAQGLTSYVSDIQSGEFVPLVVNIDQPDHERKIIQSQLATQFGQFDGAIITIGAWVPLEFHSSTLQMICGIKLLEIILLVIFGP
ncbi:SDR family NAD(P)-dependent oxidoreductase [Paenibacillus sp. D2_2]|uniref:SDR family NAD(P)-dependent oxidoreductase n=1 Tax=Paenibacillus sp. D2_2 TaxID=3073092 RepID=UPI002814BDA9|nr:SDR family NAD(P)-dependent oxidoreductase [Paenibacillus sp. D2_2]WMT40804.1 SDR family NAD(P)-dependent oxidoreductase [Paenibacillus sp. D2_2]